MSVQGSGNEPTTTITPLSIVDSDPAVNEIEAKVSEIASRRTYSLVSRKASDVVSRRTKYLWKDRIPQGSLTLMPGEEGIGKSTVAARVISDLTNGTLEGEYKGRPQSVVIMSAEDGIEAVFKPRLEAAGANLELVTFAEYMENGAGDIRSLQLPDDLSAIKELVNETDSTLLYIDSLVTTLPDEVKTISYKDVSKIIKGINEWAEQNKTAAFAPWHLNKGNGSDTAHRMMDSRAFRTSCRSILLAVADPEAPEGTVQGIVALDKANAGTLLIPGLRYQLNSVKYTAYEDDGTEIQGKVGVANWIGEVDANIARAFTRQKMVAEDKEVKLNPCEQWLTDYLVEGKPVRLDTILKDAEANGYSRSQINKAKQRKLTSIVVDYETGSVNGKPYRHATWCDGEAKKSRIDYGSDEANKQMEM